jgi:hypothetical protein
MTEEAAAKLSMWENVFPTFSGRAQSLKVEKGRYLKFAMPVSYLYHLFSYFRNVS